MRKLIATIIALLVAALASGFILLEARGEGPPQPIEFDHWQHISKEEGPQLECAACHEYADQSPNATIPSVYTCMVCHESINAESPEIKKLAAFSQRAEEPPWQRVYWIDPKADVFFSHKSHTRARIDCADCHGQVSQSRRIKREINQSMGWCIDCHKQKQASTDCYICHR
ncbi:MAG: cytochrome c3 family protein [Acidobacteriota bacterium]